MVFNLSFCSKCGRDLKYFLFYSFESFSYEHYLIVFHWKLSDSKSRTLLSILADLNNAVVWMVSTRALIFNPSSLFTNPLVTVPSAQITIGITINFLYHSFFSFLAKSRNSSLFSPSFNFTLWFTEMAKSTIW